MFDEIGGICVSISASRTKAEEEFLPPGLEMSQTLNGNFVEIYSVNDVDSTMGDYRDFSHKLNSPSVSSKIFPVSSSSAVSSSSSSPVRYLEHPVSKMDTLAGVAIKYGVEVVDIKKLNGLVTDLQMFALKTLQIPLPGRHPPSPCLSDDHDVVRQSGSEQTPPQHMRSDFFDSFQTLRMTSDRKVSPAMSSLQGYYGLRSNAWRNSYEGFEMAVYCESTGHDDGGGKPPVGLNPPLSLHRKSRSIANSFLLDDDEVGSDMLPTDARETDSDKLVRRRQKSEADFTPRTPEMLLKEENGNGGWFSAIAGKGLALRNKAVSRGNLTSEIDGSGTNGMSGYADSTGSDGLSVFRKSSSTSCLQDQEGSISSIWPGSKWSLKPDLQALSTAAIARPIFDGLSKPKTGRKSKAALD